MLKTLGKRGIECIFVGYAKNSKAFRFYVIEPNDSVFINSIIESKDAIFNENKFLSVPRPSLRILNGIKDIGGSVVPEEVTKEVVQQPEYELRKSKRNRTPKDFGPEFQLYLIEGIRDEQSIMGNNTWVLVDLPPGCKPLGYKWIFKRKLKVDGTIEKFKARLVIQGFKQKSWKDYFDTYAPVVDLTKEFLSSRFSMKDIGETDVILGIRIKHESNVIAISQSRYIEKVLKKINYFDCTPVSTPMDTSEKLMPNNGQVVSQLEYSRVIGCLMYAMTCTRPDIAFIVGKMSRYTSNLGTQHWQAIQRVLKYLKKTIDYRLTYIGYPSVLEGYIDASWISNTNDNSSTCSWVFLLGGGVISWAPKKQTCITGSIMESKIVALAAASKEVEWLKNLLLEIPLWSKLIAPISIHCDNAATLAKAYSQMYNGKSKHLGVRHNMICELITDGVIFIKFVDLTKEFLSSRFSMKDIGETDVILGIRIKHESNVIAISQSRYIEKVLKKINYFDCTPVSTPMDTSEKLMPNNGQVVSQLEYSRVIGCLMYAMTCTRPDIAFIVGKIGRYTSNLGTQHWQAIQRLYKRIRIAAMVVPRRSRRAIEDVDRANS
nr:zinc finger, CCHC-type [Tanacetum cinerariifolium]